MDRDLRAAGVREQVANGEQVVCPGGHHGQRVQIEADHIGQDRAAKLATIAAGRASRTNPADGTHQKRAGTAGRIEHPPLGIARVANQIQHVIGQPVG